MMRCPGVGLLLGTLLAGNVAGAVAQDPFEAGRPAPRGRIDELVFGRLALLGIEPANLCSDAVFLRRACLDVLGSLPEPEQARDFLRDRSPDKRAALIDRLLEREEHADYQALKWGDLLRVKAEFPINLWPNAVQAYHRWIRTCLADDLPYDRFVREMLTASGSNFRVPQVNFYRAVQGREPEALARAVALTFMGTRAQAWPAERLAGMAAFFSRVGFKSTQEWKEEIVFFDAGPAPVDAAGGPPCEAVFPDDTPAVLDPDSDPRAVFCDWLTAPENPWFARNIVNRVWSWLLGRGIVHEPDDLRADNPPSHPELLAWLEQELVRSGYDLKQLYRLILNSSTYQLSCIPRTDHPQGDALFARYVPRRLDAEVLIDALCQVTGTHEAYSSAVPEPFTFVPESHRAIALGDGSLTSPFLEMFGRPARDTGLESERSRQHTPEQRLHLLNSSHLREKIGKSRRLRGLLRARRDPVQTVRRLYLLVLSRFPTGQEVDTVLAHMRSGSVSRREGAADVVWALINGAEFLHQH